MLKISELQLEAMKNVIVETFYDGLFDFLRNELPEHTSDLDDAALRARIREDAEIAHEMGITSNRGITHFVGLSLIGPKSERFHRRPEFAEILASRDPERTLEAFVLHLQSYYAQKGALR